MHRPPNLWQHTKNGIWYLRTYNSDGTDRERCSLGTRDLREAIEKAPGARAKLERTNPRPSPGRELWKRLAAADVAERKALGVSALYAERLEAKWPVVIRNIPDDRGPDVFGYEDAISYIALRRSQTWQGRPIAGQTIYRELAGAWRVLLIAKRRGHRVDLPDEWPQVRRDPKDLRRAGKRWDPELVREYLNALHQEARDEAIVAALTQLRAHELKRLRFDAIRPAPKGSKTPWLAEVGESATKTRDPRIVGITAAAHSIIARRRREHPEAELVFAAADYKKTRRQVSQDLNFTSTLTLRDLRHTFLSEGLHVTSDATAVMRAAGHKDLKTTEKYLSSTIERTTAVAAAAEQALFYPDHSTRITRKAAKGRKVVSPRGKMERATRLELATLSLGTRRSKPSRGKTEHDRANVVPLYPGKRGPVVDYPDHVPGSPSRERKGGAA